MFSAIATFRRFLLPALLVAVLALLAGLLAAPASASSVSSEGLSSQSSGSSVPDSETPDLQVPVEESGNVVTFGDSYTASPDQWINGVYASSSSLPAPASYPGKNGCLQSPENWPRQLAELTGLDVDDWSCTGETSLSMLSTVDAAIEAGDITPSTRAVIFAIGGNDFGPFGILEGAPILDVNAMVERYTSHMQQAAAKVRSVAPDAELLISGYPQVTNGEWLCFVQVIPDLPLGVPVPGYLAEGALRDMQRYAAEATGMQLVDNLASTTGHSTCSMDDSERYVAGVIDITSPEYEMIMHPTILGHEAIAENNAAALRD